MNKRIKELRLALGLSQDEMGASLGVSRSAISLLESGKNSLTESKVIMLCEKYRVRREWLREGTGPMFEPEPSAPLDALAAQYGLSGSDYALIEKFVNLKPEYRQAIAAYIVEAAAALSGAPSEPPALGAGAAAAEAAYEKNFGIASSTDASPSRISDATG